MNIRVEYELPYVTASLNYRGQPLTLKNVLLDTGSAGTLFATDAMLAMGLEFEANDVVRRIQGVGGAEFVFTKQIDHLSVGDLETTNFEIEVGAMAYGFPIEGIIGFDFLRKVGACLNLKQLEVNECP